MSDVLFDQGRPRSLLAELQAADPEIADRIVARSDAIAAGAPTSSLVTAGLAAAAVPVALAALSRDAFAQTRLPATVTNILNFALTLEYLENEFYVRGLAASNLIPSADRTIFTTIQGHEAQHVQYLVNLLGPAARPKPTFDYTGGSGSGTGPYADVFTNYATFLGVSQAFEDTGVRAYKGQGPALNPYKDILTAALTVHSVEARHAAEVRRLRGNFQDTAPNKGWITLNQTDIPGTAAVYAGDDNTVQAGVDVAAAITPFVGSGNAAIYASEAFDEPLTMAQVLAIAGNFIAQ